MTAKSDAVGCTVGVEEEYHVVNPSTGALARRADLAADALAGRAGPALHPELQTTQLEAVSLPCETLAELRAQLIAIRTQAANAAAGYGTTILATGTHPFSSWRDLERTDRPRYDALEHRFGAISRRIDVCGYHVHVGVPDLDTAVSIMNQARPYLPLFIALTASSPFHDGTDTSYASYRTVRWSVWPIAGPPPIINSTPAYQRIVDELVGSGIIDNSSNLYWDIRPSAKQPTIEFRVADVCTDVEHAVLCAALIRSLVRTLAARQASGVSRLPISDAVLRAQHWQAARFGLSAEVRDPMTDEALPARIAIRRLLTELRADLAEREELDEVEQRATELLSRGNSADHQRRTFAETHDLHRVVAAATAKTLAATTAMSEHPPASGGWT